MAFTIEMTPRGVLLAGEWMDEETLNHTSTENKRNTMIVSLSRSTNQPVPYFQGFSDDVLVGKLAVSVFLKQAGIRTQDDLTGTSDDDQRNILIIVNNGYTDRSIPQLQGLNNQELVNLGLGWFARSRTVAAIQEFHWKVDQAKILERAPEIIETQTYDNSGSSEPLQSEFSFTKAVTNVSRFSHDHGFDVKLGLETTFEAGIPFLAKNETTVSISAGTSHKWSFGEDNSTTQTYTHKTAVTIPPFKRMQRVASVTKGTLDVPYLAKVRTADGAIRWLEGTWSGVSTVTLVDKQEDL